MSIEYLLDRIIQFFLKQVLEVFITKSSNYLTKLVSYAFGKKRAELNLFHSHVDVLHKSEHFLVVNKPPDLLLNSNDESKNTVQTILRKQLPLLTNSSLKHEFYFAHRLDFSTSGILCIPLNKKACASLCRSFEEQKCEKYYIAVVNGHMDQNICEINLAIGEDSRFVDTNKKMCIGTSKFCQKPRKARTRLLRLAIGTYNNTQVTKVLLQPVTGRRHQLRLHCTAIGHPILGDYTYGSNADKKMPRMHLHAIIMIAPNDSEDLHVETVDPFLQKGFEFTDEITPNVGINILQKQAIDSVEYMK